jgi:16S rRNA (guanine966-N2)-methyltransferase
VRIISGSARGRTIVAPEGTDVRPTTDRVREAVFNALYSAGALDGQDLRAVDLFAGSGALGLEALSRGFRQVDFVERSRAAVAAITENLETFGFADRATVNRGDAFTWLESAGGTPGSWTVQAADVVFCDPPYAFGDWPRLLELVTSRLAPSVLVVESDAPVDLGGGWSEFKTARYASTVVQIARPAGVLIEVDPDEADRDVDPDEADREGV